MLEYKHLKGESASCALRLPTSLCENAIHYSIRKLTDHMRQCVQLNVVGRVACEAHFLFYCAYTQTQLPYYVSSVIAKHQNTKAVRHVKGAAVRRRPRRLLVRRRPLRKSATPFE